MICIVETCEEPAEARDLCEDHLRRHLSGTMEVKPGEPVQDVCNMGHPMTGSNVRWESAGKRGGKRRRCKACLSAKAKKRALLDKKVRHPKPYRPEDVKLTNVLADFDTALSQGEVKAKCKGNPGPYMDWDERNPPSKAEAQALCAGCPFMPACDNARVAGREPFGVWGGKVIIDGKWIHKKEKA